MKEENAIQIELNEYFARKSTVKGSLAVATVLLAAAEALLLFGKTATVVGTAMGVLLLAFLWLIAMCFFKHNVNGMQCALGAFLATQLVYYINAAATIGRIAYLPLICSVLVFVTHQFLVAQHKGKSNMLFINQLAGALFILLGCVLNCVIPLASGDLSSIGHLAVNLFTAAAMNMIITIETRINEYKTQRDALTSAGEWNDEAKAKLKKEIFG